MSNITAHGQNRRGNDKWQNAFLLLLGVFLGLCLVKFGNPVLLEHKIRPPQGLEEVRYQAWPNRWAYLFFIPVALLGLKVCRWHMPAFRLVFVLPLVWLCWQCISATQSVSPLLTSLVLRHFIVCVICFYLGWLGLAETKDLKLLWPGILIGYIWVLHVGFDQHFWSLEATRRRIEMYGLPDSVMASPDFLKRVATGRIFSTLFYPNTLGAVIVLFLPACGVGVWQLAERLAIPSRMAIITALSAASLACLWWSGSRSGLLLMVGVALAAAVVAPVNLKWKAVLAGIVLTAFSVLLFGKSPTTERGTSSLGARLDYWRAAVQITATSPMFGTGPGTFSIPYSTIKPAGAEMARATHNDFLEQACDSGIPGFLAYFGWIAGSVLLLYRYRKSMSGVVCWIGIGVVAVFLQGLLEFNLYIPAVAWPSFIVLGHLVGSADATAHNIAEFSNET